ncbi:MAG: hypothetical protein H5T86_07560 [Armatimonadetes bacterium]|nr:hypothetical protein [Armatimonadota bacterium]
MSQLPELALAGLLHDIGKFSQRAFPGEQGLSDETKRIQDYVCPVMGGRYTDLHAAYTAKFC